MGQPFAKTSLVGDITVTANFLVTAYHFLIVLFRWLPIELQYMLYAALALAVIFCLLKVFAFILDLIPFW